MSDSSVARLPAATLHNHYGPTEATVGMLTWSIGDGSELDRTATAHIGKPLPNVGLFIIDKWRGLQPIGVPGELCISGAGLARGMARAVLLERDLRLVPWTLSLVW